MHTNMIIFNIKQCNFFKKAISGFWFIILNHYSFLKIVQQFPLKDFAKEET